MASWQSENFTTAWNAAAENFGGPRPPEPSAAPRLAQWRREEWHNWFRWRVCRGGFDWSKPVWIVALAGGFGALIAYGLLTGRLFVTAGGIVAWFTAVNLAFFSYFGLTLPGPPRAVPGPFEPGQPVRASIGIYPAGYERRKRARVWARVPSADGPPWVFELPFESLPGDLAKLMERQATWRIQRADAPATQAVLETLLVARAEIDAGAHPVRITAWSWDEQALTPFGRA